MKQNPKHSRVAKCVRAVKRKHGKVNPYAVCTKSTGQAYRTGKRVHVVRKANPSGKHYVIAYVKGRPAYMGTYDEALETDKRKAVGFSTKVMATSEARRMAKLWPSYQWGVESP